MRKILKAIWPRPDRLTMGESTALKQYGDDLDVRIKGLQGLGTIETALHLEAARRITEEEERRKSGAENRATTFIAAVAALIPLMTWAIGGPTSTCSPGWGCSLWTAVLTLAVLYFITAAYWALRTLAVANYHVIGVEDIVQIRQHNKDIFKELTQQTLLQARRNRDTINQKLTFIKVAQQRFFNGLILLGILLLFDPVSKLGLVEVAKNKITDWVTQPAEKFPIFKPLSKSAG